MKNAVLAVLVALAAALGTPAQAQFSNAFGGFGGFGAFPETGAFAGPNTGESYHGGEARRRQAVEIGRVEDVRKVVITSKQESGAATIGAVIGGGIGVAAGSEIGAGVGTRAAQVILGLVGGWGGKQLGDELDVVVEDGLEIIVRFPNGDLTAVVQAVDDQAAALTVGDVVRVVDGKLTRVARHGAGGQIAQF